MIILNADDVSVVAGESTQGHWLVPIALANGTEWVLPEAVLSDPSHAEHHDFLAGLPTRSVDPSEFPQIEMI